MFAKVFQRPVAIGETGAHCFVIAPTKARKRSSSDIRELTQGFSLGHRAVMQSVIPCKVNSGEPDLPEGAGDGLAVGDMQHEKRLS